MNHSYVASGPYQDEVFQPFIPELVEDGEVDGEGDGSDMYQPENEDGERWDMLDKVAQRPKSHSLHDLYALSSSVRSYYLRMEATAAGNFARLIRHRGSILPFCEVVHVVHPLEAAQHIKALGKDPLSDVQRERWVRVMRALKGEDVDRARLLTCVLYSPANLRAIPTNMAAFGTMMLRDSYGHGPPNYKECWFRSTAWGYYQYHKAVKPQHDVILASLAKAVGEIAGGGGGGGMGRVRDL